MNEPVVIVTGLPQVKSSLDRLAGIDAKRIRERAIVIGSKMTVGPVRQEAPVRTGNLRDRVGSFGSRARTSGGFAVGRDPNSRIVASMAPHRHLVVRGTGPRYTRNGAYRGIMPSNPFVDRGWQRARVFVLQAMSTYAMREIGRLWRG